MPLLSATLRFPSALRYLPLKELIAVEKAKDSMEIPIKINIEICLAFSFFDFSFKSLFIPIELIK